MALTKKLLLLALVLFTFPGCPPDNAGVTTPEMEIDEFDDSEFLPAHQDPNRGVLEGAVTIDKEPAEGITVTLTSTLLPSPKTTTTDQYGFYYFDDLEEGAYTVTISGIPPDVRFNKRAETVDFVVPKDEFAPPSGPDFRGFRDVTVDVLIFIDNAYPTASFVEAGPEPGGCDEAHWHSHDRVPLLATRSDSGDGFDCAVSKKFRKSDPAPRQCGHGTVKEVLRQDILLPRECLDAYGGGV